MYVTKNSRNNCGNIFLCPTYPRQPCNDIYIVKDTSILRDIRLCRCFKFSSKFVQLKLYL